MAQQTNSIEAEMSVLGACLLDPDRAYEAVDGLVMPEDFASERHRVIFAAILETFEQKRPVDLVTVGEILRGKGFSESAYLAEILDYVPSAHNAGRYAQIVKDLSVRRKIAAIGHDLIAHATSNEKISDIVQAVESSLYALGGGSDKGPQHIKDVMKRTFARLESLAERRGEITGIKTGIRRLDMMLNGLNPGKLYVVAARPAMGKSAFGNGLVNSASVNHGVASLTFSLEMPDDELAERHLYSVGRIDGSRARIGMFGEADYTKLTSAAQTLSSAPAWIDDSEALPITEIRSRARRMKRKHDIGLIVVDYLQLCTAKAQSREQEIAEISRNLKSMAKELKVPVVALSQLNRSLENRTDKRPMMSDLRESGAIEQDSDVVAFIYRESVYCNDCKAGNCTKDHDKDAEIIIGKQRGGPVGTVRARWIAEHTRFEDDDHV